MARRFNYTGRRKIFREDISIRILNQQNEISFTAELRLDAYEFPADARVHVEAYRGLSALWKRFDFGRVALRDPIQSLSLNEFDHPEGILFRVKVSAEGVHKGRLLGEADGIRPVLPDQTDQQSDPLIEVDYGPLGGDLWRISFPDGDTAMPTLVINDRIEEWQLRARDPLFQGIVLPAVMREILMRILVIDANAGDEENPDDWRQRWLKFSESLPDVLVHPSALEPGRDLTERSDLTDWINDAVSAFGKRSGLTDNLISRWNNESHL